MIWYKLYIKSMEDIKFKRLKKIGRQPFAYYWTAWSIILDNCPDNDGSIPYRNDTDLEIIFEMIDDISVAEVVEILEDIDSVDLITFDDDEIKVNNWHKYQSDTSRDRVAKHRKMVKNKDIIDKVITTFNELAGSRYSLKTEANRHHISARVEEGHTYEEMVAVIQDRIKKWSNDPKMKQYIRPSTLFLPANFDKYLNEIPKDYVDASAAGKLIHVRDMYGNKKHVTQAQFDKAADGFFTVIT